MADVIYKLPSGREIDIKEPSFGDELHIVSLGAENIEEMIYAKFAVMVPSLTREEVAALPRADGRALALEVGRVWDGRPEEQEAPFGPPSSPPAAGSESMNRKQRRASMSSRSATA